MIKTFFSFSIFCSFSMILFYGCSAEENSPDALQLQKYLLTVTASEGGVVSPRTGTYLAGTVMTIVATPDEGYDFDRWQGSDDDNKPNPCGKGRQLNEFSRNCRATITINSNRNIQAFFRRRE